MYRVFVFDVDGVLTPFRSAWQRLHSILGLDAKRNAELYSKGYIDYFEWALVDTLYWFGVPKIHVEKYFQPRRGFDELCAFMSSTNLWRIAVSAGVGYTRRLSHCFDFFLVNDVVYKHSAVWSIAVWIDNENKDDRAGEVLKLLDADWGDVIAVGDGESDISILRRAGLAIAFNPTSEKVEEVAHVVIRSDTLYPLVKYLKRIINNKRRYMS